MLKNEIKVDDNSTIIQSENLLVKPLVDISTGIFVLRFLLGIVFFAHGGQKVFGWFGGHGLTGTASFMATMGVPTALAYLASLTEFFGALALIAGLLTRPAALGLAITMAVAVFKVHLSGGFFLPTGIEYALTLLVLAVSIFILGPGKYSLDNKFFGKK